MRHAQRILAAGALTGFTLLASGSEGTGLTVSSDALNWPRWQTRLLLTTPPPAWQASLGALASPNSGTGNLSLMSDYYLTGSLLGSNRPGGFRATSGILIGQRAQGLSGSFAPPRGAAFSVDRGLFGQASSVQLPGDASAETATVPYFGFGYSGLSLRSGWSFNADLGLASRSFGGAKVGGFLTGNQSLDDTLRDMRWQPVLQLGVSYSF